MFYYEVQSINREVIKQRHTSHNHGGHGNVALVPTYLVMMIDYLQV